jgi:glycerophosphoryl diester phosphodiesterase
MKRLRTIYLLIFLASFGCRKNEITTPPPADNSNLVGTQPIPGSTMKKMEGIYKLSGGSNILGEQFVCKVSRFKVSFFSNKDGLFFILNYGYKASDGSIQFSGFWRYSERTEQGNIQFSITAANGATDLLAGIVKNLVITGVNPGNDIQLKYDRPFSAAAINRDFIIFAHHGVQTTANPPYAENSLLGVLNDEDYGVTGLEYDIRMTGDNVPICIHDPSVNTRLTVKGPLSGTWDQYPFSLLDNYIRLIDNQKIPSVEQALNAFIDSTTLTYFWMDIKGNKDIFKYLEPIVRKAYARAATQNRKVVILAGLPSSDVIEEFHKQPTYGADLPTLSEESIDVAITNGSKFFGPRFSKGLLLEDVAKAHSKGIRVISWTLNDKTLIRNYLEKGQFDGFITDYPAYVVYDFYTLF